MAAMVLPDLECFRGIILEAMRWLIGIAASVGLVAAQESTPVILISIDTLRADHLSAYGSRKIQTPNIDSFAQQGTIFTDVNSQIPLTLPSHTSLFTSTYPFENGVEENAEVVRRSAECARKTREACVTALYEKVFTTVQDLIQRDMYPSLPRVKAELSPGMRRSWPLLRYAIDNALSRLGSVVSPRNELGQFM